MFTLLLLTNFARCTFDADDITDLRNRLKVLEEELINLKATCYRPEKTMRGSKQCRLENKLIPIPIGFDANFTIFNCFPGLCGDV